MWRTGSRCSGAWAFGRSSSVAGPVHASCTTTSSNTRATSSRRKRPSSSGSTRRLTFSAEPGISASSASARRRFLLEAHGRRRDLDAVARHDADQQVAPGRQLDLAVLLRLPVVLAAGGDGAVGAEDQERRVRARAPVGQDHRQVHGALAVDAEPPGVVHPVDVQRGPWRREASGSGISASAASRSVS